MRLQAIVLRVVGLELVFVVLWNSGFIGAEVGLAYASPLTLLLWRYAALSILLGGWLGATGRRGWPGLRAVGRTALVGVLAHGVWLGCALLALSLDVPAGIVALVTALQPLLTGALAGVAVGERTDRRQWAGLILGFCGVAIAVGARLSLDAHAPALGYLLPFGSVVAITAASLMQRRWHARGDRSPLSMDVALFIQSLATAVALLLPAWWFEGLETRWAPPFVATLAWLVLAVSLGAYWCMWRLLEQQEATRVASLFYLSPPVTMLMAWVAFRDQLIPTDLVGLAVAAIGVVLVYRTGTSRRPSTDG